MKTCQVNKNEVDTLVSKAQFAKFILDMRVNPSIIQNKVRSKGVHYPGQVTFQQLHVLLVLEGGKSETGYDDDNGLFMVPYPIL